MLQRTPGNTGEGLDGAGVPGPVGVRWTADVGEQMWSAPIVANGVVIGCGDEGIVRALDVDEGTEKWQYSIESPITAAPVASDETIYIPVERFTDGPSVLALSATDGSLQWSAPSAVQAPGLTLVDGVLYVQDRSRVWALDAASGGVHWQVDLRANEPYPPAVVDGSVYVGGERGRVHALAAENGDERWRTELAGDIENAPTVADGRVFVESASDDSGVTALDVADGDVLWQTPIFRHTVGSVAVADGSVYVGSIERWIYAFDAEDGTRLWRSRNEGVYKSAPAVVDDTVYFGSVDDSVYALATDDGSTRWQFELSDWVVTSPAVVDNVVYVGTRDGTLYALEQQKNALPVPGFGMVGAVIGTGAASGYRVLKERTES